ncbi:hypothetical protein CQW23_00867 [Capsicum baccatum]|uniref:Uncharacterized protein n=1 Tax=Capsicum baccatum TaxID=33114 RepID=A0A2G2XLX9_CAPBA|nr:hypothetical protein CQW23_00867 [Capsicum baccatum]
MLRRNTHIIVRGPKKNDAPLSTKGDQLQLDGQGKLSLSSKSKVITGNPNQSVQVATKSKNSKGMDTHVDKRVKSPSSAPKAVAISTSEVINVVHKIKKSSSPLGKGVEKSIDIVPFCSDASKPPVSLDGVAIGSAPFSSNESNASQEPHWKRLKKNHKDLSDQHREFADLDSISIDIAIFEDGAAGSAMTLGLVDVSSNIFGDDVFGEDFVTILNPLSVLKSPNLSLDNAMTQASYKDPPAKLPKNVESFQNISTIDIVAKVNNNRPSNAPKDFVQPS